MAWASEKVEYDKKNALKNSRGYKPHPDEKKELERQANAIGAEYATAKALGVNYSWKNGNFGKPDLHYTHGQETYSIQVKYGRGDSISVPKGHLNVDFVIGVTGSFSGVYDIIGCATPDDITGLKDSRIGSYTLGNDPARQCFPYYKVPVSKLRQNVSLLSEVLQ